MLTFSDISKKLPGILQELLSQKEYDYKNLTRARINSIFGTKSPIHGIYLMHEDHTPVYVGRSRNMAQRIGTDHRANNRAQASLAFKLTTGTVGHQFSDVKAARTYMFNHFTVQMIQVEDVHLRTFSEIYVALELGTKYNSFVESK